MTNTYPRIRLCKVLAAVLSFLMLGCQTVPDTVPGDSTSTSGNQTAGGTATGGTTNSSGNQNAGGAANTPRLFVMDGIFSITSYTNALAATGNITPATKLDFADDFLPRRFVVTKSGQFIVLTFTDDSMFVFDNATTLTGLAAPNRIVKGDATLLNAPKSMALDVANDQLYVAGNNATDGILVFDNVSSASFNGNIAPSRTFIDDNIQAMNVNALSLDSTGALFVYDGNRDRINVFANAGALSGVTVPTQIFTSDAWGSIESITVDNAGVLYAADGGDSVFIFKNALGLNGDVSPDAILTPTGDGVINSVIVASDGRGFLSDNINNGRVLSFANIASRSGSLAPDREITGSKTGIVNPFQLILVP